MNDRGSHISLVDYAVEVLCWQGVKGSLSRRSGRVRC